MDAVVEWVDARERLPEYGMPVAAATTGRYPDGEHFWLVIPSVFWDYWAGEDGIEHRDCFVDSDGVVRLPYGRASNEQITHWAYLPALPGRGEYSLLGAAATAAVRSTLGRQP